MLLLLANMLVVLILLVNMLIAHLSNAYGDAQKEGKIRFSIDKAWMVSKLEQSHFKVCFVFSFCHCGSTRCRRHILIHHGFKEIGVTLINNDRLAVKLQDPIYLIVLLKICCK